MSGGSIAITGAAGGIGAALAEHFLHLGWRVTAIDTAPFPAALTAAAGFRAARADITDEDEIGAAIGAGPLDAMIANAAVTDLNHHEVTEMPAEVWRRVLRVNVDGAFLTARAAARAMRPSGRGNIVFVTSSLAFHAWAQAGDAPYSASKAAVEMLARVMACELAPHGINVNTLFPSVKIDTGFFAHLPAEERAALAPATILNAPAAHLAALPPGAATGRSLDQARWDADAAYRAEWGAP